MVEPIAVHVFTNIAPTDADRVTVYEASNSIRLARGVFIKIDGATVDDHQRIVNAIRSVCREVSAVSGLGAYDVAS